MLAIMAIVQSPARTFEDAFMRDFLLWFYSHQGHDHAVKSRVIEERFGISYRAVQFLMEDIEDAGVWVCSGGDGYHWTDNPDEYIAGKQHFRSRGLKILRRYHRAVRRARTQQAGMEQKELWDQILPMEHQTNLFSMGA